MLQTTYGRSCMNRASVFEWHKRFKEDRESVRDDETCGRIKEVRTPELISKRFRVRVRVTMLKFKGSSGRDCVGRGQHCLNRVSGIFPKTMHQSTTPFLSQTIWPRWASRQFLTHPIVETLLPVTFGYSLSSEAVVMRQLMEMKESVTMVIDTLTQDFYGSFKNLLERYKCIGAGGDYFEGNSSFMCVLSIKVPIRKKPRSLFNDPRIRRKFIYIYIYIYNHPQTDLFRSIRTHQCG